METPISKVDKLLLSSLISNEITPIFPIVFILNFSDQLDVSLFNLKAFLTYFV